MPYQDATDKRQQQGLTMINMYHIRSTIQVEFLPDTEGQENLNSLADTLVIYITTASMQVDDKTVCTFFICYA